MPSTKINIKKTPNHLKIYLDGILHLYIKEKVLGIQSWIMDSEIRLYKIEYYLKDNSVTTEYVDKKLWVDILKQLDKI